MFGGDLEFEKRITRKQNQKNKRKENLIKKQEKKVRQSVSNMLPDTSVDEETAKKYLESLNINNSIIIGKDEVNEVELSNLLINFANEYGKY